MTTNRRNKLSVIIPCSNAVETLSGQLDALAEQVWSEPWEVIISDNGRNEGLDELVAHYETRIPGLRIVNSSDARGRAHARNAGAMAATSTALAFTDADDIVGEGWVAAMGSALAEHSFVACRMDTERLNPAWVRKTRFPMQVDGLQKYVYPPYLPHAGGSTLGIRKTLFQQMGGFDETLRSLEDTDLCWRVQLAGTPLVFVPDAVVHVRYRNSIGEIFRQAREFGEHNVLLYKRYMDKGMPRLSKLVGSRKWIVLMKQLARVHSRAELAGWMWRLGWNTGRLHGSIKYKVFGL